MKQQPRLRGVNLGGWLVLEKWMTPSVFAGTNASNEYELAMPTEGKTALVQHHQAFVQE